MKMARDHPTIECFRRAVREAQRVCVARPARQEAVFVGRADSCPVDGAESKT